MVMHAAQREILQKKKKRKEKHTYLSKLECKEEKVIKSKTDMYKVLHKASFTTEHQKDYRTEVRGCENKKIKDKE